MTNYVTQFLPVLQPKDWMKVEVGSIYGGYAISAITLGDLKKYLAGESSDSGSSNSSSSNNSGNSGSNGT